MTNNSMNGNRQSDGPATTGGAEPRLVLAPHLWPETPAGGGGEGGPVFYLSWPGWEMYLRRRLGLTPDPAAARPLLLPDLADPERDFAAIDQLVKAAGQLGAGLLSLDRGTPESLPALTEAIAGYGRSAGPEAAGPLLDDRSYLALWAANEYQAGQSRDLLAEAAARQEAMWADLKGLTDDDDDPLPTAAIDCFPEIPDARSAYAWRCWRRLAAPLLRPSDRIVPTAAEEDRAD